MLRKIGSLAVLAAIALASQSCIITSDQATLTVHNHSQYMITEVRLAPVHSASWGPNQAPGGLYPGEDLVITGIDCDDYDVLVVDNHGNGCVRSDMSLCMDDRAWYLDNATMETCSFW